MPEYITVKDLKVGECGNVVSVSGNESMVKRLNDLGIIKDTKIYCIMKSPLGDPAAYLIRGALIAIRNEDAENICAKLYKCDNNLQF